MKVLIDTNIFIDFLQNRQPFAKDSRRTILQAINYEGFVAASSITDIYYLQHQRTHNKDKTKRDLADLLKVFNIVDTTEMDCRIALRSNLRDFEDAILVESAKRSKMDCIVTRNAKDFKDSGIPVYTPSEFLRQPR